MSWILAPISAIFAVVSYIRWRLYRWRILPQKKAPGPVVSVGNIGMGGTGKTPCAIWLAAELKSRGFEPAILTRGYRRTRKERMLIIGDAPEAALAGDEPALMARKLPDIPIAVDADRAASAKEIGEANRRVFILDDGFQHLKLDRDFDIVLLPGNDLLSGEHFFPWGNLRDGRWRLSEADTVILVGERASIKDISYLGLNVPIFTAKKKPVSVMTITGQHLPLRELEGSRVVAFAGIANPSGFKETLESIGAEIAAIVPFPDHHRYSARDIKRIEAVAENKRVDILVTTEKDAVRLVGHQFRLQTYVVSIEFAVDRAEELIEIITEKIGSIDANTQMNESE
ncbi:tetraacyldisaccharide 4'-kinase [bacterium]|nr:MAG: tetraacyldisaccharide 4'-kinase [bacterium]